MERGELLMERHQTSGTTVGLRDFVELFKENDDSD